MIRIRRSGERGHADHGWLDTRHTFSFADYHDPDHMGFRTLRVINEDVVQPGRGFGTHGHRDMEILTWVLSGTLAHRDSLGNGFLIRRGEVQRMTAGTGVTHSEVNPSEAEPVHLLQIWILPERKGLAPGYEQKPVALEPGRLVPFPVTIHQDAKVHAARLEAGQAVSHALAAGRHAWVQLARGSLTLNGTAMAAGDGAAVSGETTLILKAGEAAEFLLFDLD